MAATVRYWAGARAAAGVSEDPAVPGEVVGEVVDAVVARRPALAAVVAVASLLVDGRRVGRDEPVPDGAVVEVLPPFAGG